MGKHISPRALHTQSTALQCSGAARISSAAGSVQLQIFSILPHLSPSFIPHQSPHPPPDVLWHLAISIWSVAGAAPIISCI